MRIICKLLALPVALVLSLAALILSFVHGIAGALLNTLCGICVLCGLFSLFIDGNTAAGISALVIALFISPCGLPLIAELLLNGLADLSGSVWGFIVA